MSARQSERLYTETREARLHRDSEQHRNQWTCLPVLNHPSVHSKMLNFHRHFVTLEVTRCSTCCKGFPGLKINSQSGECLSCSRDKHVPKLYSSENNMNPGIVPPALQVRQHKHLMLSNEYCMCLLVVFLLQGLTQVEEMLISAVLPIMSLIICPMVSGHVINLPQDIASFANSVPRLPSDIDVIIVKCCSVTS